MKYLVVLILILISCELSQKDIYHNLPTKYKTELNDKDTLVFYSNNQSDTFSVRIIRNAFFQEPLSGSECKSPHEFWEFEYLQYNELESLNNNFSYIDTILKYNINEFGGCANGLPDNYNSIQIHYGIRGVYTATMEFRGIYFQCMDTIDTLNINNIEYLNVFHFLPNQTGSEFSEIFFCYKTGILKYIRNNFLYELKSVLH